MLKHTPPNIPENIVELMSRCQDHDVAVPIEERTPNTMLEAGNYHRSNSSSYSDNAEIWYHGSSLELSVCAGQGILCRKATTADIEKMIQIDPLHRHEQITKAVRQEEGYLAEETAQIIGFAIMNNTFFDYGFVWLLIVAEEHRRRGIGAALLDYLSWQCKAEKLFTSTNESNVPMRGLLVKSGFMLCGRIDALDESDPELFFVRKMAAK